MDGWVGHNRSTEELANKCFVQKLSMKLLMFAEQLISCIFIVSDKSAPRLKVPKHSPAVMREIRQILNLDYDFYEYARARIKRQYKNLA